MKAQSITPLFILLLLSSRIVAQSITFSELMYNADSTTNSGNWVELYNYGAAPLNIGSWYIKDNNNANILTFPANTTIAADGRLVVVNDVVKFTAQYPGVSNYIGQMPFSFGNDSDQVRLFDNTGVLKVFMAYYDTFPWPKAADGSGRTLEQLVAGADPNLASSWFSGCMFGSPGTAYIPCVDPLVFGEINYNSDTLLDAGDWIELYNNSASLINLNGWSFKDSKDSNIYFFQPGVQLDPQERVVVVNDVAKFLSRHPAVSNFVGPFNFNLSNNGELVRLFGTDGKIKYSMVFDDADHGWYDEPDGGGFTLELQSVNPGNDVNVPQHWFVGCPEGSPGVPYDPDCPIGISENTIVSWRILTYQDNELLNFLIQNLSGQATTVTLLNLNGIPLATQEVLDNGFFDTSNLASGIYLLKASSRKETICRKIFIQ